MIEISSGGAFCVENAGEVAATAVVVAYGEALAWVGMVITHPDLRRQGIGRQLMSAALDHAAARDARSVMLDATEAGRPLYEALGFRPLYRVETWTASTTRHGPVNEGPQNAVRPATSADLDLVVALDHALLGVNRELLLRRFAERCWVTGSRGSVDGYILTRDAAESRIGPWYHSDPKGAELLLDTAIGQLCSGDAEERRGLRLDVPQPCAEARGFLVARNFTTNRFTTRMVLGDSPPGRMTEQYSIASFATG